MLMFDIMYKCTVYIFVLLFSLFFYRMEGDVQQNAPSRNGTWAAAETWSLGNDVIFLKPLYI